MWTSTGRSGYGDSTIGGDYDSWDGVSPNGKQYKNEATQEVRNLSGYRYWDMRKQNSPEQEIPVELHMLSKERANIEAYADPVPTKRKTSVPLIDRVLPQQRRVRVLTEQLYELEAELKNGLDIQTYSQLRDVLIVKRDRAELLLKKALSVRPIRPETDEDSDLLHTSSGFSHQPNDGYASEELEAVGVVWIDELSETNSLKSFLKFSCKVVRKAVQFSHRAAAYYQTLKEV